MKHFLIAALLCSVFLPACRQPSGTSRNSQSLTDSSVLACPPGSRLDTARLAQAAGMHGTGKNGEYKIAVPRKDLQVTVDGFSIIPPMGLTSWAAFTPCSDSAMVMGDIVVTETELWPVQQEVIRQGLVITAIHHHFARSRPAVFYMHIDGKGDPLRLARSVKAIFRQAASVRQPYASAGKADSVVNTLPTAWLDSLIGHKGEMNKGVYKYTIGRNDVQLLEDGIPVSSFLGFNTWAAWQGTPEKAAVAGDFAMLENEVEPVIRTLVKNGIEVVAVHNHMTQEQPRIFFLHYWGTGPAEKLAKGLRAALDVTGGSGRKQ
jgi:hypothetical protein